MQEVIFSTEKHIGVITLNRPKALNALTLSMIEAMQQQLLAWQDDSDVHAIIVRAADEKAFCAGGDIRWLYDMGKAANPSQMQFFRREYQLNLFISSYPKPYIALLNGLTMGGGVGISLHGSHPVATERFCVAMPETSIGFFPDIGASYLLSRLPKHIGIYLGLTGARLNAREAQATGLVHTLINSEDMNKLFEEILAADLSTEAAVRVDEILAKFNQPVSTNEMVANEANIVSSFGHIEVESIMVTLERGKSEWAIEVFKTLKQKSPLSLKVTLSQLLKARTLELADCLQMDYLLVNHFMRDHDFYEGVRALIIDKDKSPKWKPASLAAVSASMVAGYFEGDVDYRFEKA